ncbi:MAG: hypothetical protein CHACPFDD_01688 [Phycisphaerae bacterium]|nr:hypothetical protein [Phycisphaerae bacterium]
MTIRCVAKSWKSCEVLAIISISLPSYAMQSAEFVPGRLSDSETNEVVQRVAQQQSVVDNLMAEFRLEFELKTGEQFSATYDWARSVPSERLETRFTDVPEWAKYHGFDDELFVATSDRTVELLVRSNQVIIMAQPHPLATVFTPLDFLRPGTRRSFDELARDGAKFDASRLGPQLIELCFAMPEAPDRSTSVLLEVREGHYLVTAWKCDACKSAAEIEYERQDDGQWFPSFATFNSDEAPVVRQATMKTTKLALWPPAESAFAFEFRRGMTVTDTRDADNDGNSPGFMVDENGNLVPAHVVYPVGAGGPVNTASALRAGAASAGLILAVLAGRHLHRRKQLA